MPLQKINISPSEFLGKNILFFDSDCLFCKRSIMWIYRRDKNKKIEFGSTKLESGQALIPNMIHMGESTIIYVENYGKPNEIVTIRSKAILSVLATIYGLPFKWLGILSPLWDVFYRLFAKYRKQLIRKSLCEIPKDSSQFIDFMNK